MNSEKKKYRFNAVDIIVIVILLAVIAFCAYKMRSVSKESSPISTSSYIVTVEMTKMREGFGELFHKDEVIYSRTNGSVLGKIVDVKIDQCKEYTVSAIDGSIKQVILPDKYDITYILEINSSTQVAVGQYISFKTNRAVASGTALSVELVEGGIEK